MLFLAKDDCRHSHHAYALPFPGFLTSSQEPISPLLAGKVELGLGWADDTWSGWVTPVFPDEPGRKTRPG